MNPTNNPNFYSPYDQGAARNPSQPPQANQPHTQPPVSGYEHGYPSQNLYSPYQLQPPAATFNNAQPSPYGGYSQTPVAPLLTYEGPAPTSYLNAPSINMNFGYRDQAPATHMYPAGNPSAAAAAAAAPQYQTMTPLAYEAPAMRGQAGNPQYTQYGVPMPSTNNKSYGYHISGNTNQVPAAWTTGQSSPYQHQTPLFPPQVPASTTTQQSPYHYQGFSSLSWVPATTTPPRNLRPGQNSASRPRAPFPTTTMQGQGPTVDSALAPPVAAATFPQGTINPEAPVGARAHYPLLTPPAVAPILLPPSASSSKQQEPIDLTGEEDGMASRTQFADFFNLPSAFDTAITTATNTVAITATTQLPPSDKATGIPEGSATATTSQEPTPPPSDSSKEGAGQPQNTSPPPQTKPTLTVTQLMLNANYNWYQASPAVPEVPHAKRQKLSAGESEWRRLLDQAAANGTANHFLRGGRQWGNAPPAPLPALSPVMAQQEHNGRRGEGHSSAKPRVKRQAKGKGEIGDGNAQHVKKAADKGAKAKERLAQRKRKLKGDDEEVEQGGAGSARLEDGGESMEEVREASAVDQQSPLVDDDDDDDDFGKLLEDGLMADAEEKEQQGGGREEMERKQKEREEMERRQNEEWEQKGKDDAEVDGGNSSFDNLFEDEEVEMGEMIIIENP